MTAVTNLHSRFFMEKYLGLIDVHKKRGRAFYVHLCFIHLTIGRGGGLQLGVLEI
jgi:hypothetical protein